MVSVLSERLKALQQICQSNGSELIVVSHPTLNLDDQGTATAIAGRNAGVKVIRPSAPGEITKDLYRDGFHLTPEGAKKFTLSMASALLDQSTKP